MAHELTLNNGVAEMAYVGDKCWHGLGQRLELDSSIEQWQVAAGMDWKINRAPLQYDTGDYMNPGIITDKHVLFRSDSKAPLGVVSDNYKIVQPSEVLEFFRDLVSGNGFSLHTAGTLFGGKRMWALASIGEQASIMGQDKVGGFLLLSTSCDGTMATEARFTTVRVVCNNTLSMARSEKDAQVIKMSHKTAFNAKAMHDKLGIATDAFAQFMNASRQLANTKVDNVKAREFVQSLMFAPILTIDEQSAQARNKVDSVMRLFQGQGMGAQMDSANGTAWGLLNAVTEYVDHHASAHTVDARLSSALFDKGADLKSEAFEKVLQLV